MSRRHVNWWAHDGTVAWAVNAAGQLVEMRGDGGRWLVTVWTPLLDQVGPMVFNFGRASVAQRTWDEVMSVDPDELGITPAEQIRRHFGMRAHPSWDHDGEAQP